MQVLVSLKCNFYYRILIFFLHKRANSDHYCLDLLFFLPGCLFQLLQRVVPSHLFLFWRLFLFGFWVSNQSPLAEIVYDSFLAILAFFFILKECPDVLTRSVIVVYLILFIHFFRLLI